MNRERIVRADAPKQVVRRAAAAHVVFGVDFEKIDLARLSENILAVFGFEPGARGAGGHGRAVDLLWRAYSHDNSAKSLRHGRKRIAAPAPMCIRPDA